jgi:deoxycytidine triphosphate deaminase
MLHPLEERQLGKHTCSVTLTLKKVWRYYRPGSVWNTRENDDREHVPFEVDNFGPDGFNSGGRYVQLGPGAYSVDTNEFVNLPMDKMAQVFPGGSLIRAGAMLHFPVLPPGGAGPLSGLLVVVNPFGIRMYANLKIGEIVFHEVSREPDWNPQAEVEEQDDEEDAKPLAGARPRAPSPPQAY